MGELKETKNSSSAVKLDKSIPHRQRIIDVVEMHSLNLKLDDKLFPKVYRLLLKYNNKRSEEVSDEVLAFILKVFILIESNSREEFIDKIFNPNSNLLTELTSDISDTTRAEIYSFLCYSSTTEFQMRWEEFIHNTQYTQISNFNNISLIICCLSAFALKKSAYLKKLEEYLVIYCLPGLRKHIIQNYIAGMLHKNYLEFGIRCDTDSNEFYEQCLFIYILLQKDIYIDEMLQLYPQEKHSFIVRNYFATRKHSDRRNIYDSLRKLFSITGSNSLKSKIISEIVENQFSHRPVTMHYDLKEIPHNNISKQLHNHTVQDLLSPYIVTAENYYENTVTAQQILQLSSEMYGDIIEISSGNKVQIAVVSFVICCHIFKDFYSKFSVKDTTDALQYLFVICSSIFPTSMVFQSDIDHEVLNFFTIHASQISDPFLN